MTRVRLAARRLIRDRQFLFTLVALVSIGLGVLVAVFSVVEQVLVNAIPYANARGVVIVDEWRAGCWRMLISPRFASSSSRSMTRRSRTSRPATACVGLWIACSRLRSLPRRSTLRALLDIARGDPSSRVAFLAAPRGAPIHRVVTAAVGRSKGTRLRRRDLRAAVKARRASTCRCRLRPKSFLLSRLLWWKNGYDEEHASKTG